MNNISINVFGLENDVVVPIQLSRYDSDTDINYCLSAKMTRDITAWSKT